MRNIQSLLLQSAFKENARAQCIYKFNFKNREFNPRENYKSFNISLNILFNFFLSYFDPL